MADSKLENLTAETTFTGNELLYVVDDPAGTPVDRKAALSDVVSGAGAVMDTGAETIAGVKTFSSSPIVPTPTTATQVAPKSYVDGEITALDEIAAGVRTTLDTATAGFVGVDVDLASGVAGGDTLTGGTAASENLTLASTAHATRGTIFVRDLVSLASEDKTHTSTSDPLRLLEYGSARTYTLNDTGGGFSLGNAVQAVRFASTLAFSANGNVFGSGQLFINEATIKNTVGSTPTITAFITLAASPTLRADTQTIAISGHRAVSDTPTTDVANAGTLTVTNLVGLYSGPTILASSTVTNRYGMEVKDATGGGTLTTQIGVQIDALTKGGTNIGIRNNSTTVNPPSAATLSAAGNTIAADRTVKRLNNNSGGSLTLTSAPTIADGQDGQRLLLFNSSANDVVLQDQGTLASSNLRLSAASITLGTRDSIELMYSSTVGDWIQVAQVNVL